MLNFCFNNLLFVEYFKCHDEFRSFLSSKVHMSKLSSTHWFSDFKVINIPWFRVKLSWSLNLSSWRLNLLSKLILFLIRFILEAKTAKLFWFITNLMLRLVKWLSNKLRILVTRSGHFWHWCHVDIWDYLMHVGRI